MESHKVIFSSSVYAGDNSFALFYDMVKNQEFKEVQFFDCSVEGKGVHLMRDGMPLITIYPQSAVLTHEYHAHNAVVAQED